MALTPVAEEATWVERLASGDTDEPARALYGRYARRLYGFGLQLLGEDRLAQELVQETFVRLWRHAGRFDRSSSSVHAFVFTIAKGVAADLRQRSRPPEGDSQARDGRGHTPANEPSDDDLERLLVGLEVRDALDSLPAKHRETLDLYTSRDLNERAIADRLELPLATVKTRTYHALLALGAELEERGVVA